jgi:hypothetical protein
MGVRDDITGSGEHPPIVVTGARVHKPTRGFATIYLIAR